MLRSTSKISSTRFMGKRRPRECCGNKMTMKVSHLPTHCIQSAPCCRLRVLSSSSSTRKKSTIVPTEDMLRSSSSSSTKAKSSGKDDTKTTSLDKIDSFTTKLRRQYPIERVWNFPRGAKQLYLHALRYKNIHDASRTPLNAWTIDHPWKKTKAWHEDENSESVGRKDEENSSSKNNDDGMNESVSTKKKIMNKFGFLIYGNERRPGRIPRRQYEQQRQTMEDYKLMGILLALWMPPIIGDLPVLLAAFFPRQVLTRQFHNPYEWEAYAQMEYSQRKSAFIALGDQFWGTILPPAPRTLSLLFQSMAHADKEHREDAAGPMIDAIRLYAPFVDHNHGRAEEQSTSAANSTSSGASKSKRNPANVLSGSVYKLPREYLVKLSLATGIYQSLPKWLSPWITEWTPTWCLAYQIDRVGRMVVQDDILLLEEEHDITGCSSLTDTEVLDACLIRGLPVMSHSAEERRLCLTNHLKLIRSVKQRLLVRQQQQQQQNQQQSSKGANSNGRNLSKTEGFRLFTLHLNPLRYHLKVTHSQGTAKE